MESYSVISFIFGFLILVALIILFFVNQIIFYRNMVEKKFNAVLVGLEARVGLIENMVKFINDNLEAETILQKKLLKMNEAIKLLIDGSRDLREFKKLEKNFVHFTELEETYSFLENNKKYLSLKEECLLNKNRVDYSIEGYDEGVSRYNNYKSKKHISILSNVFRFQNYDYYGK